MARSPQEELTLRIAERVDDLFFRENLFQGGKRAVDVDSGIPVRAVFVQADGGPPPNDFKDGGSLGKRPTVQIMVRGDHEDHEGGLQLARRVLDACTFPAGVEDYHSVMPIQPEPSPLPADDDGHPLWVFGVEMWIKQAPLADQV